MSRFALAFLIVCTLLGITNCAHSQDNPKWVIDRAIQAHGGEERLTKLKARHFKIRGVLFGNRALPFTHELYFQTPHQVRDLLIIEADGRRSSVVYGLNGNDGWIQMDGQVKSLPPALFAEMKEATHLVCVSGLNGIKDPENQLKPLPAIQVGGRAALGVQLSSLEYRDIALYFDKETGLLVKVAHFVPDLVSKRTVQEERFFSDWKDLNGLITPAHVEVFRDGKKYMEADVIELSALERLDENLFTHP